MGRSLRKSRTKKVVSRKKVKTVTQRKRLNPCLIKDDAVRAAYDKKKTLKQNLASMDVKVLYSKCLPDSIPTEARHVPKVNEDEVPVCKKLFEKHGEDYDAMHWDVKLNEMQWTTAQCKKRMLAWRAGKERSAAAEIMSGHGMDLRKPVWGAKRERNVFGH